MARGGARPGAGRKRGAPNKRTAALQAAVQASGETPLDYMLRIMRDAEADQSRRDEMAKAAAPFVHSKLQSIAHSGGIGVKRDPSELSDEELAAIAAGSGAGAAGAEEGAGELSRVH